MPRMEIRFKKAKDAATVLTFVRPDGSHTLGRIGPKDQFGPVHDLTHYVIESVLGYRRAFLGLCAEGMTIEETGTAHGLPPEAYVAEVIAGHVSRMEAMHHWDSLEDFNWAIAEKVGPGAPKITQEEYDAFWRALKYLRARWNETPDGGTLSLQFEAGVRVHVNEAGEMNVPAAAR